MRIIYFCEVNAECQSGDYTDLSVAGVESVTKAECQSGDYTDLSVAGIESGITCTVFLSLL